MGTAYYFKTDRESAAFESAVDGKALARASERLDQLAETLGVEPVSAFVWMSQDDVPVELDLDELEPPEPLDFDTLEAQVASLRGLPGEGPLRELLGTARRLLSRSGAEPRSEAGGWFSPDAGLSTVTALLAHIGTSPDSLPNREAVAADLRSLHGALEAARAQGLQWRLAVDI